jgi:hypothetical protein
MTTFKVWYSRSLGMGEAVQGDDGKTCLHFSSARSVRMSKEAFERDYVCVGEVEVDNLEAAWALLNDADPSGTPNPLGDPKAQELIRRERLHSSMSVGDVLEDDVYGDKHVAMGVGFATLEVK